MGASGELGGTFTTADGRALGIFVRDESTFEAMRVALGDPVWLVGATWDVLCTNDYKRGRFVDAFGAWVERQDAGAVEGLLEPVGVVVTAT